MAAPMDADNVVGATKAVRWVCAFELDALCCTGFVRNVSFAVNENRQHAVLTTTVPIEATTEDEISAAMAAAGFRAGDNELRAYVHLVIGEAAPAVFRQSADDHQAGKSKRSPDGLADEALEIALEECTDGQDRYLTLGAAMRACVAPALRVKLSTASIDATITRAFDHAGSLWTLIDKRARGSAGPRRPRR
ncbi:hypothetical protein M885DRAFT_573936 [Pelagophyceae sp. CCMP2097]|nr:hypothetical protein M885DRAFT_573936 [Pelagophyceae sp. CCMP2097]